MVQLLRDVPLGSGHTWDAENRLTQVVTRRDPADQFYLGDTKIEFKYDWMGRRARKTVSVYNNGAWQETADQLFVYDGWNVVEVLDANAANAVKTKYTWGLDMSGLGGNPSPAGVYGARGISGLLASVETGTTDSPVHWYFYDGNGNVGQVLDATDTNNITTVARYEYDPYGNTLSATGTYAAANPFRFSTKWFDTETGLSYFGYRYYNARLGRWMSRDPSEELGVVNLCTAAANAAISVIDALGKSPWSPRRRPKPVPPPASGPEPIEICDVLGKEGCTPKPTDSGTLVVIDVTIGSLLQGCLAKACGELKGSLSDCKSTLRFENKAFLDGKPCDLLKDRYLDLENPCGGIANALGGDDADASGATTSCDEGEECCHKASFDATYSLSVTINLPVPVMPDKNGKNGGICTVSGTITGTARVNDTIGKCERAGK